MGQAANKKDLPGKAKTSKEAGVKTPSSRLFSRRGNKNKRKWSK
jgi:hypothetical protein